MGAGSDAMYFFGFMSLILGFFFDLYVAIVGGIFLVVMGVLFDIAGA